MLLSFFVVDRVLLLMLMVRFGFDDTAIVVFGD